ncbi:BamA/TamA family outer membrane protein [Thermosipho ferrireducens]|uniref:BamA/TamA family outer membrane protein n=1 Tax=Thermosipho ferrireducens TaxID=2571116 RepID=A0ABX7SA32_9BACT|nr:POTRA domain-containing protein [Thermosipho ferrireducens]QTA38582.1 BamA/TamA family outer membrane protein [Thermosipho ferrireducens]
MKKLFLIIGFILTLSLYVQGEVLNSVTFEGLKTVPKAELESYYEDYINLDINDYAIEDIVSKVRATGYFSSVEYTKIASGNNIDLVIKVSENSPIESINLNINGAGLIDRETIEASITLEENKAFSFVQFKKSIENISELYKEQGYIVSNVFSKNKDESFVYISGKINGKNITFSVTEYALYDVEFSGNIKGLEEEFQKINNEIKVKRYKNYLSKGPILRFFDDEKSYYPKASDLQTIFQQLSNYVYFSPYTNIQFLTVDSEKPAKILKILVVQNTIVRSPTYVEKIEITGNSIYTFDDISSTPSATYTNAQLLKILQKVKDKYNKGTYFVNLSADVRENVFLINVVEMKFGKVTVSGNTRTKLYTFDDLIKIKSGDFANKKALQETYIEIYKLQYFDNIDFDITPEGTNTLNTTLILTEKEKKFNFLGGGTWGPVEGKPWYEGFAAQVQISAINPVGFGQTISSSINLGVNSKNISLEYGIRKPNNLPLKLSGKISYNLSSTTDSTTVYILSEDSTKTTETSTNLTKISGSISLSTLKINNNTFSFGAGVSLKNYETTVSTTTSGSTETLTNTTTSKYTSAYAIFGYAYENLDDLIIPTKGFYFSSLVQKYFRIDGDAPVAWKLQEDVSLHVPIKDTNFSLAGRIYGAQIFQDSGENLVNYLSGLNGIRGLELSGKMVALASFEIRYVDKESQTPYYIAAFADTGTAGESYLTAPWKWTGGIELGLQVPMFGLIRVGEAYLFEQNKWNFFFLMGKTF